MTSSYTARDLQRARYSTLNAHPQSEKCNHLCTILLGKLLHQVLRRPNVKQHIAFAALIADLLEVNPAENGGWLFRSMSANSFSGEAVGYRPFLAVFQPMQGLMIEFIPGTRQYTQSEFTGGKRQPSWGRSARYRATGWLRDWFAAEGITWSTWSEHFIRERRTEKPRQPSVILRTAKRADRRSAPYGRTIHFDPSGPEVAKIIARMDRLNAYLWDQTVEPYGPVFLRRIFSNADQPDFVWEAGGRLTAFGSESFQTAKKRDRAVILINGTKTEEIDIRASHLTIMVGLGHLPETILQGDSYEVEGIPRDVVKQWVTMTLGHGKRHVRWPPATKATFLKKHSIDLSSEFPIKVTGDAILAKLPILEPEGGAALIDWGRLQYLESEAILKTMEVLAFDHNIPSLPIHDSLIVPEPCSELGKETLKGSFKSIVGVEPVVI